MIQEIRIIDDFLSNPLLVRQNILQIGFKDEEFENTTYHTVNSDYTPNEIARNLSIHYNSPVELLVAAFRQGKENSPLHNLVHADNTCASIASVLYLNLPEHCQGGTAFWQHKKTGWYHQPTAEQLDHAGITIEEFGRDWHNSDAWEMSTLVGMKFNRAVTYPTTMFHSRWPWQGFGDNDDNARLIHAAFINLL